MGMEPGKLKERGVDDEQWGRQILQILEATASSWKKIDYYKQPIAKICCAGWLLCGKGLLWRSSGSRGINEGLG